MLHTIVDKRCLPGVGGSSGGLSHPRLKRL